PTSGINKTPPPPPRLFHACRQHHAAVWQPFTDQNNRLPSRNLPRKPINKPRLADLVDRVDHIARTIMRDCRQFFRRPLFASSNNQPTNRIMQPPQRLNKPSAVWSPSPFRGG